MKVKPREWIALAVALLAAAEAVSGAMSLRVERATTGEVDASLRACLVTLERVVTE